MLNSTYQSSAPETLIFPHIPKNAGRTFESILERQYAAGDIYDIYGYGNSIPRAVDRLNKLSEGDKRKIKLIKGHYQFGLHKLLPQNASYITFLRDPVRRVISHYNYVLRDKNHPLNKIIAANKMSLADYVSSGVSIELNNGQTRLLSGQSNKYPFGQCKKDLLEDAKINLQNHFSIAGIVERFDDSLALMSLEFGWRWIYYLKKNVTPVPLLGVDIDKNTLNIIEKYNQYDLDLYDFAKKELDKKVLLAGVNHRQRLRNLAVQNCMYRAYALVRRLPRNLKRLWA